MNNVEKISHMMNIGMNLCEMKSEYNEEWTLFDKHKIIKIFTFSNKNSDRF